MIMNGLRHRYISKLWTTIPYSNPLLNRSHHFRGLFQIKSPIVNSKSSKDNKTNFKIYNFIKPKTFRC